MSDATVDFSSTFATKILANLDLPFTAVDQHTKFKPKSGPVKSAAGSRLKDGRQYLNELEQLAQQKQSRKERWADEFLTTVSELRSLASKIDEMRKAAIKNNLDWIGPSQSDTDDFRVFKKWDQDFNLEWIKVVLNSRPKIRLNSPVTDLDRVIVSASATGELWVKHPWWKCDKTWHGICYHWREISVWTRLASLTVRGLNIAADAKITFGIDDSGVVGVPRFKKFRLNHPILKEIPIELLVNLILDLESNKGQFAVLGSDSLEIPILGITYTPDVISLPRDSSGLQVTVIYKKKKKSGRRKLK